MIEDKKIEKLKIFEICNRKKRKHFNLRKKGNSSAI